MFWHFFRSTRTMSHVEEGRCLFRRHRGYRREEVLPLPEPSPLPCPFTCPFRKRALGLCVAFLPGHVFFGFTMGLFSRFGCCFNKFLRKEWRQCFHGSRRRAFRATDSDPGEPGRALPKCSKIPMSISVPLSGGGGT